MAEASGKPEQLEPELLTDSQLKLHIDSVDSKCESPEKRALKVYEYLKLSEFTTWDIICFCANYAGIMSTLWNWLEEPAKLLSARVYRVHYFFNDKVLGEESKLK